MPGRRTSPDPRHRSIHPPPGGPLVPAETAAPGTHRDRWQHLQPRSEGGKNTLDNLITLCTAHHRASHRGELIIETTAAGLVFRHADGTPYGDAVTPTSIDAHAKVFSALRNLGFREREARAVLTELRKDPDLRQAPTDQLLREALGRVRRMP